MDFAGNTDADSKIDSVLLKAEGQRDTMQAIRFNDDADTADTLNETWWLNDTVGGDGYRLSDYNKNGVMDVFGMKSPSMVTTTTTATCSTWFTPTATATPTSTVTGITRMPGKPPRR